VFGLGRPGRIADLSQGHIAHREITALGAAEEYRPQTIFRFARNDSTRIRQRPNQTACESAHRRALLSGCAPARPPHPRGVKIAPHTISNVVLVFFRIVDVYV
jgi:hypothetical protein